MAPTNPRIAPLLLVLKMILSAELLDVPDACPVAVVFVPLPLEKSSYHDFERGIEIIRVGFRGVEGIPWGVRA